MNIKTIRTVGAGCLAAVWLVLTGFAWFSPAKAASDTERRPLEQWPVLSTDTLLSGQFMGKFEDYTLDQFPFRDAFRTLKSLFHYYAMNQSDNNDIYIADGYAVALEYPMNGASVDNATRKFNQLYEKYLQGSKVYMTVAPDKGYYLAEQTGYPALVD